MSRHYQAVIKETWERLTAGLLLLLLSPVLAALALVIKFDSPGPVFYQQERVGLEGAPFQLLKLRTMTVGAETQGAGWEIAPHDQRITRAGWWLRRSSLDELPQLVNVVRGDMALIGPRPTLADQVDRYTPRQRRRHLMKPGLTGLAQVSGRNSLTWDERIELDLWYVDHWSLGLDLQVLLRTPRAILSGAVRVRT